MYENDFLFLLFVSFLFFLITEQSLTSSNAQLLGTGRQNRAISSNCPRSCPSMVGPQDPVCGSDGIIYANVCEMKKKTCSRLGANTIQVIKKQR